MTNCIYGTYLLGGGGLWLKNDLTGFLGPPGGPGFLGL